MTTRSRFMHLTVLVASGAVALSACSGDGFGDGAANGAKVPTRTVTDASGAQVQVPVDPQRVVTTHYAATQPAYDLGEKLVGQGDYVEGIIPEARLAATSRVPVVTNKGKPDIEKIAELKPDLILVPNITEDDVFSQLQQIAPTYRFTLRGAKRAEWQGRVNEIADVFGDTAKAAELRQALEARQRKIASTYASVIKGKNVAVVAAYEENNFYAWGEKNMTGTLLMPLGFTWSKQENAAVASEKEPEATLSEEKIGSTVGDADVLFYDTNLRKAPSAFMQGVMATPLYKELKAVKANRAFPIGKTTIAGYGDANYSLDQVETALKKLSTK